MDSTAGFTVGHIPFLNCVPCFHFLKESGFAGRLVSGVPSALNSLLQQRKLDISPSSSFEYAQHWRDYLLLPGHSISSVGKIQSVLLFSPVELSALNGRKIAITGESATSINLLRVLLREFVGLEDVSDSVPSEPVENLIARQEPALLIGDRALRAAAAQPAGMKIYDLGEVWYQQTGLPFVFALWMIRREALGTYSAQLESLSGQLWQSYEKVMQEPEPIAALHTVATGLNVSQIVDYWHGIDYRLDDEQLEGLQLFFRLCEKHKLLQQAPPVEFLQFSSLSKVD